MKKLVVGLDVGVSSVGWSIVDYETWKVIDYGVRLFPERTNLNNLDRRTSRSSRRLIRRRIHRTQRIKKLLIENGIINENFIELDNPYHIRCLGLKEKLTNEQLATAILHIAKRRGVTGKWTISEKNTNEETTKGILNENELLLKNKYICEVQYDRLVSTKCVRGIKNNFTTDDYIKELNKIFSNQSLSEDLKNKIINIIKDRREYYEGPGNELSLTPYGRFYIDENGQIKEMSMIDKMRGRCSVFPNEFRAAKKTYAACMFNFLNDLNNIKINDEHIDVETKKYIIDTYINKKGSITIKQLEKELNVESLINCGLRTDANGNLLITKFDGYKKIKDGIDKNNYSKEIYENKELLDNIIDVLAGYKGISDRYNKIKELNDKLTEDELEYLSNLNGFSGYHSLSLKAINYFNKEMLQTDMNQMQILQMSGLLDKEKKYFGLKNIPFNNELILSPTAKRSQKEAIKVLNAIRKQYGELDSVVIEMAREKNSQARISNIKKYQKEMFNKHKRVDELLEDKKVNAMTKLKIQLYIEQDCKTAYKNKEISLEKLINDPTAYEIDHIIPLSISLNDSLSNKVLVTREENQEKGQRTPYQYLKSGNCGISYEDYKTIVMSNKELTGKYGYNKRGNLLYEKDINSYNVKKEFINRNLVDTRYATRGILNTISEYYSQNEIPTKVYTINGSITNIFRKKVGLDKNRDKDSSHHAIDSIIIAGIKKMKLFDNLLNITRDNDILYDKNTGEIITLENEKDFFDNKFLEFIGNLKDINNSNVKYSYRIDSKCNKSISDQTIYGTRKFDNQDYVIGKYKNIYGTDGEKVAKLIREGKENKLLIYKINNNNENSIYNIIKSVVEEYPNEKNPFQAFYHEHNDYIRKYSKNGNGPIIKDLKCVGDKIGESVIYLDNKYKKSKDRHVILKQLVPYRNDIYKTTNGEYKMLVINQCDLSTKNNKYYIEEKKYNELMNKNNISSDDTFIFSLYKDSIISINNNLVRYAGVNNINSVVIHYKTIGDYTIYKADGKTEFKRPYINIKKAEELSKYNVDILGNIYKVQKESCKLEIDML